ncbi:MAG: Cell division protein ZapA [Fibrobacteria bacterium]|jgi:cell division protein ZapA (FtsZ GTPase activity inhibitor)|nr:Cell division protein ZapA [Fibrobacteria bacterium]
MSNPTTPTTYALKLQVGGEIVQLKSDQPPEVVQKIASYLNARMQEADPLGSNADKFRLLALAALSVTGELFEAKAKLEETDQARQNLLDKAQTLTDSLDRVL